MFPFDEPLPTAFYLVLYLATLVLHVVPMNYVLAGSTTLAAAAAWEAVTRRRIAWLEPAAAVLRDWMPLALSVAITMGVAPLLFIQILYKQPFYTANLLLFHRWMAILPVLIAAFYLLYVQKSKRLMRGRPLLRLAVSTGVLACFAFVAWSWTENHLLSTRGQAVWVAQYASGGLFYGDPELPPRLLLWYLGAFPTLAAVVAWQLWLARSDANVGAASQAADGGRLQDRPLATAALTTLAAAGLAAAAYGLSLPTDVRGAVFSRATGWLVLAGAGAGLQAYGWWRLRRAGSVAARGLALVSAGVLATTGGMTVVREARRLAAIDISNFYADHAQASSVGGLGVFLFFAAVNILLIAGVVVLVRRGLGRYPTEFS